MTQEPRVVKIQVVQVPSAHEVAILKQCERYALEAIAEHHDDLIFGSDEDGQHGR